jgi:seryl-tRNA synthetase
MEIQYWIIAQMVIDLIIAGVLLWFIRVSMKPKKNGNEQDEILRKSVSLLEEMKELNFSLEKSLEEKRRLSSIMVEQLDDTIEKAEETFQRAKDVAKDIVANPDRTKSVAKNSDQMRTSVRTLIAKGLPKEEIAQHLGMSVDEIDLLIKLQAHSGQDRQKTNLR